MSECELCGKPESGIKAIIEGSMINVCKSCAKFGNVVEIKKQIPMRNEIPFSKRAIIIEEEFETLKPNYAELIKTARESSNLEQKEAARLLGEKLSMYQKIESGSFKPSVETARKFEKFFKIKLIESYREPEKKKPIDTENSDITIGDLLSLKK